MYNKHKITNRNTWSILTQNRYTILTIKKSLHKEACCTCFCATTSKVHTESGYDDLVYYYVPWYSLFLSVCLSPFVFSRRTASSVDCQHLHVVTDGVVAVFTLNPSSYPTSAVPPVSFLILHPREMQIMWSRTKQDRKIKKIKITTESR